MNVEFPHGNQIGGQPPLVRKSSAHPPSSRTRISITPADFSKIFPHFSTVNRHVQNGQFVLIHKISATETTIKLLEPFNSSCLEKICCIFPRAIRDICLFFTFNCCGSVLDESYEVVEIIQKKTTGFSSKNSSDPLLR